MEHRVGGLRGTDGLGGKSRDQGQKKSAAGGEVPAAQNPGAKENDEAEFHRKNERCFHGSVDY